MGGINVGRWLAGIEFGGLVEVVREGMVKAGYGGSTSEGCASTPVSCLGDLHAPQR